jgi:hypothetical protein
MMVENLHVTVFYTPLRETRKYDLVTRNGSQRDIHSDSKYGTNTFPLSCIEGKNSCTSERYFIFAKRPHVILHGVVMGSIRLKLKVISPFPGTKPEHSAPTANFNK